MSWAHRGPGSIQQRLRALLASTDRDLANREAAEILGVTVEQVRSARADLRRSAVPAARKSEVRVRLDVVSHFERGIGQRRETCVRYEACLFAFADSHHGQGRCPRACDAFAEADREIEFLHLAASRPRAEHG